MKNEPIKMCFDMLLPPELRKEARRAAIRENPENGSKGALVAQKKWRPGRVLRVRFLEGLPAVHAKIEKMAMEWTEHANIGITFGNDPQAEIRVAFQDDGSWSYLGTDALTIDARRATMNYGWLEPDTSDTEYARVVKHEFGHALGMIHEHSHPEAGIPWNKPAVYAYYAEKDGWTKEEVDQQLFSRYEKSATQFSAYDRDSIMHYPVDKGLTIGGFEIGWNTKLSPTDKEFIGNAYPGRIVAGALVVNAEAAIASIGKHGEQDLYSFTVESPGVYVIETQGPTDVVASLFNDLGQLVTEDDDSGQGRNAKIVSTLQPGLYRIRVRHYQPRGTGDYKISVRSHN